MTYVFKKSVKQENLVNKEGIFLDCKKESSGGREAEWEMGWRCLMSLCLVSVLICVLPCTWGGWGISILPEEHPLQCLGARCCSGVPAAPLTLASQHLHPSHPMGRNTCGKMGAKTSTENNCRIVNLFFFLCALHINTINLPDLLDGLNVASK